MQVDEQALASGVIAQIHKAKLNIKKLNEIMLHSEKNRSNENENEKDNKLEKVNVKSKVHDFALNLLIDTQFLNS